MGNGNDQEEYTGKEALQRGSYDFRSELQKLINQLEELKVRYEQYFLGVAPREPDKEHADWKKELRVIQQAPFKSTEMGFRLRALESKYNTYYSYWQRVLRAKETGTYRRDATRHNINSRHREEHENQKSKAGSQEKSMQAIFNTYKSALEKISGAVQEIDYNAFKASIKKKAHDLKKQAGENSNGVKFKIVVKGGKVNVEAELKS